MIEFLKKVISDENETPSTKRIIALVGSLSLFVVFLFACFTQLSYEPSKELLTAIVTIICVGLGATSLDKFSKK